MIELFITTVLKTSKPTWSPSYKHTVGSYLEAIQSCHTSQSLPIKNLFFITSSPYCPSLCTSLPSMFVPSVSSVNYKEIQPENIRTNEGRISCLQQIPNYAHNNEHSYKPKQRSLSDWSKSMTAQIPVVSTRCIAK